MSWAWPAARSKATSGLGPRLLDFEKPVTMPDLLDPETGWYQSWYFRARLNDEVALAGDSGKPVTLVFFRMPLGAWEMTSRLRIYLTIRLGLMEREVSEGTAFFGRLSEEEFAVCISGTDDLDTATTVMALHHTLTGLSADIAVSSFPHDGEDGRALIESARTLLSEQSSNLVYMDEYRRRRPRRAA